MSKKTKSLKNFSFGVSVSLIFLSFNYFSLFCLSRLPSSSRGTSRSFNNSTDPRLGTTGYLTMYFKKFLKFVHPLLPIIYVYMTRRFTEPPSLLIERYSQPRYNSLLGFQLIRLMFPSPSTFSINTARVALYQLFVQPKLISGNTTRVRFFFFTNVANIFLDAVYCMNIFLPLYQSFLEKIKKECEPTETFFVTKLRRQKRERTSKRVGKKYFSLYSYLASFCV